MKIEPDALECQCSHQRNVLRFYHGYRKHAWSDTEKFQPTFFEYETFWSLKTRILLGALWFLLLEAGVAWMAFFAPTLAGVHTSVLEWVFFATFSLFGALITLNATYLSMEFIDTACHVLIGRAWYLFMDEKGKLHLHEYEPQQQWSSVLKVRVGGLFRRCELLRTCGSSWNVSVGLFSDHILVTDENGSSIAIREFERRFIGRLSPAEQLKNILRFMDEYTSVSALIHDREKLEQVEQELDTLGIECTELVHLMEASKQTMGRSKHAQLLRERLEAVFKKMPESRVKSWETRVAKAKTEPAAKAS